MCNFNCYKTIKVLHRKVWHHFNKYKSKTGKDMVGKHLFSLDEYKPPQPD